MGDRSSVTMFLGISWLTTHIDGIIDRATSARWSAQIAIGGVRRADRSASTCVQFFTAAILILAANTAYQDFPRLSSILARDRYMPRQFMNRGDRLVFSNGVIVPRRSARSLDDLAFDANLNTADPALRRRRVHVVHAVADRAWSGTGSRSATRAPRRRRAGRRSIVINTIGAITTGVVLVVVTATKFKDGAWLSILVMAMLVPLLLSIHRHYASVIGAAPARGAPDR